MNRLIARLLVLTFVVVAALTATVVHAQDDTPPLPPQAFYGSVEVNGQPAPVGAQIEARAAGVKIGIPGNPLAVTVAGQYGELTEDESKPGVKILVESLVVQGSLQDGTPIEFYVDGVKAECAQRGGEWQTSFSFQSEGITELNLRVGGGSATATPTLTLTNTPSPSFNPAATATQASTQPQPTATRQEAQANVAAPTATLTVQAVGASPTPPVAGGTPVADSGPAVVATPTGNVAPQAANAPAATPTTAPVAADAAPTTQQEAAPRVAPTAAPTATAQLVAQQTEPTPEEVAAAPRVTATPLLRDAEEAPTPSAQEATQSASRGGLLPVIGIAALITALVTAVIVFLVRRSA